MPKALRLTGIEPASDSLAWVSALTYHFRNSIEFALLGADFGTPAMKMPIWAIAFSCFGTTPKSSLPATLVCAGSSAFSALPEYWMMAPASPPRIAAPSWSESNSTTPLGAFCFIVPTKKSADALPSAELKIGFHFSSKKEPPNDRKTGYQLVTIGLPETPRKTTGYLILPAATPSLPLAITSSQVLGAPPVKTSLR
ncbi:hypothetical protein AU467_21235 [Mesorhizobium loti]|uniref:Uncharacterized protein n=1 Tax=Rhizobium loti TaxID=381 RepID=A0A124GGD9_RHILI|nr:hypothetical protein AU467_21235 [Mesorhizobium loti]